MAAEKLYLPPHSGHGGIARHPGGLGDNARHFSESEMPDGSFECGLIMSKLESIEAQQRSQSEAQNKRFEALDSKIDELIAERNRVVGVAWALWKIGGVVGVVFGLVGWIAINGIPHWIKEALKP